MILGIVGSEAAKFTAQIEAVARRVIRDLIRTHGAARVVSGRCLLDGVDIDAVEEARALGVAVTEFPPRTYSWQSGYMPRNVQIAEASDYVACITLKELPPGYAGMRWRLCYHCGTTAHVKSGGCWTVKYARKIGKSGEVIAL